jgi:hypothetical protein
MPHDEPHNGMIAIAYVGMTNAKLASRRKSNAASDYSDCFVAGRCSGVAL